MSSLANYQVHIRRSFRYEHMDRLKCSLVGSVVLRVVFFLSVLRSRVGSSIGGFGWWVKLPI